MLSSFGNTEKPSYWIPRCIPCQIRTQTITCQENALHFFPYVFEGFVLGPSAFALTLLGFFGKIQKQLFWGVTLLVKRTNSKKNHSFWAIFGSFWMSGWPWISSCLIYFVQFILLMMCFFLSLPLTVVLQALVYSLLLLFVHPRPEPRTKSLVETVCVKLN